MCDIISFNYQLCLALIISKNHSTAIEIVRSMEVACFTHRGAGFWLMTSPDPNAARKTLGASELDKGLPQDIRSRPHEFENKQCPIND